MENVTLAVAKSYAEELLMGQGAIKGADGKDGADGVDGFSPIIVENASNTDEVYKLDITTKDGTFTTTNLIGKQGVQGIQGIQGERGEQGETGLQGQQGIQGVKGDKGDDGYPFLIYKQYEVGLEEFNEADFPEIGLMFMIHVFEEDKGYPVYRYTADGTDTPYSLVTYMNTEGIKGEKGDRGEQGEQGIAGLDGKDGKDGTTYTPSIGEVTTVDSTELASATVSIKEDTKEAVFNFAIPKGEKGEVPIDDVTASENSVWSSKKTSDEIADIESALGELENITRLTDFDEAIPEKGKNKIYYVNKIIGTYKCAQWRVESMYYDVSGAKQYRGVQKATSINGVDNIMLMREYYLDNNVMRWSDWTELATMDKVALKQEQFDKKVTLTDSNWKYETITFEKNYNNTPSVNVSCGDYLNINFYSYWGCEAHIININNKGCNIRYRSSKASESDPLEVNIIVFVNGI